MLSQTHRKCLHLLLHLTHKQTRAENVLYNLQMHAGERPVLSESAEPSPFSDLSQYTIIMVHLPVGLCRCTGEPVQTVSL